MKIPSNFDYKSALAKVSYGDRPRPVRDWFAVLGTFALLVGLSIGWNLWLLRQAEREAETTAAAPAAAFDAAPIESARAVFAERAAQAENYRSGYRFVDPGIPRRYDAAASTTPL